MPFKDILKNQLSIKNSELLSLLPAGYQQIGDICIINLDKKLNRYKKEIGKIILKNSRFKTVLNKKSGIKGKKRLPNLEIIAGNRNTETIHREAGIKYKLDPRKVMFSKGNVNERHRIAKLVKKNEVVVDMFAGIGYFTIPIAKQGKAKMIYACEINPISHHYLNENIRLNKINKEKIKTFRGNCRNIISRLKKQNIKADRILMGLLPSPKSYLKDAKKIANTKKLKISGVPETQGVSKQKGAVIHYEAIASDPKELIKEIKGEFPNARISKVVRVKSYRPKVWHFTIDASI
jgi:tRNA wybutosine-synthesizing protein 2